MTCFKAVPQAWQAPLLLLVMLAAALLMASCSGEQGRATAVQVPDGDPERGRVALEGHGCGTCHTIPGVNDADATVGPPLDDWGDRIYIAGLLNNTPANLIQWIQDPQSFEPGTAMPDMGVNEQAARDMAAYLYTLQRDDSKE